MLTRTKRTANPETVNGARTKPRRSGAENATARSTNPNETRKGIIGKPTTVPFTIGCLLSYHSSNFFNGFISFKTNYYTSSI